MNRHARDFHSDHSVYIPLCYRIFIGGHMVQSCIIGKNVISKEIMGGNTKKLPEKSGSYSTAK
ncbi:hypothetical protein [Bacillus atrophaeus]|uniref:hypothetical protein n=1 Tax=Bacillus atrophaeus TaxID=1452 RepID=UPI002DB7CEAD|nr:hypothetical protein [Bacillus atrophaeus]MEC0906368.1 hypothetical protein [Bacillus atrophaeus]